MIVNKRRTGSFLAGLICMAMILSAGSGLAAVQSSAGYGMKANILPVSGGAASSANYALKSAAGQSSAIGQSASASYKLSAGFFLALPTLPVVTAPGATTNPASNISAAGATLNGTVNDNGADTTVTFDYGLTTTYGTNIAATTGGAISAGTGSAPASAAISGLGCNSTYHFRVNGQNSAGTTNGNDLTFTTPACGKNNQTIGAVSFTPNTLAVGGTTTAGATATSGLAVVLTSTTPSVCAVSGSTVTALNTGTCTISANQPGNANYNAAEQVTRNIAVTLPLALTVSALPDGAVTTDTTQNVSGMVTNPDNLGSLTVNSTSVQVNPDGSFSYPVQLVAGANEITVIATTNAGGTITDTRTITLDDTAPHLTVTYPPDNKVLIQNFVTVSGTISDLFTGAKAIAKTVASAAPAMAVTYTVNGSSPQAATLTDTTYSFTANLVHGMNTILVSAVNSSGKTAQAKRTACCMTAFSLAITDPASDIRTVQDSYLLTGIVSDNTTPVTVTVNMDGLAYTPTVVGGAFQQQLSLSDAKVYQVSVAGTDHNSNCLTVQRNIIRTVPKAADGAADPFTIVDALLALKMSVGIVTPQIDQILRLDVAPMVNGISVGNGNVDIEDAIVILRMAVGLL